MEPRPAAEPANSWHATHELSWTPPGGGKPLRSTVMMVPDPNDRQIVRAFTYDDWSVWGAHWAFDRRNSTWQWTGMLGHPTPRAGAVTLKRIDGKSELTPRGLRIIY
jgi:hypothetical protein